MANVPFQIIPAEEETTSPDKKPGEFRFTIVPAEEEKAEPPRSWSETAEGLKKTAIAKGAQSAAALATGSPLGSIETFAAKDLPTFARGVGTALGEKFDIISPQRAQEINQEPLPWLKDQTEFQQKGYASPITHIPTWKGATEMAKEIGRNLGAPDVGYEPKGAGEKILGEAITGAAQGIPGATRTMAGRVITGAAAGAGAEAGTQYAGEGEHNEGIATLVGAFGGGLLGHKLANGLLPTVTGRDRLAEALAEDIRKGQTPMSVDQARKAIAEGTPLTIVDMAGPKTLAMLGKYGNLSEANQSRVGQFNKYLEGRAAEAGERAGERVREVMGVKALDADAIQQLNEKAGALERNRIYGYLKGRPEADAVPVTGFNPKLINDENFAQAYDRAAKNSARLPESFNIKIPEIIPGSPGVESTIKQTERGLKEMPGVPPVPTKEVPGNFAFYQQVDQELSDLIKTAERQGDKGLARGYQATQNNLRDELDNIFLKAGSNQTYREAQGAARTTFVGQEAPEAGYNFAKSLIGSQNNPFKRGDVRREFNAMTPENQEFVRLGVAARIQDEVEGGRIGKVANKFLNDASFRKDLKHVLGEEKYNHIYGSIISENLTRQADQLRFIASRVGPLEAGGMGASIAIPDILAGIMQGQGMSQIAQGAAPGKAILGFLGAMGIQQGFSAMERRVAEKILPMALSKDPKDFMKIAEMADQYPAVNQIFNRFTTTMASALTNFEQALERAEQKKNAPKPAQAHGGRIERRAGGRVASADAKADALVRAAEVAKKQINKTTEPLLNSDDDHIAKALEVANRHI